MREHFGWTQKYMQTLVDQLPADYKDGSIIMNNDGYSDIGKYLTAYAGGIICMAFIWQAVHKFFTLIEYKVYMQKNTEERGLYACIHY